MSEPKKITDKIINFYKKQKAERRFKAAGPGHKLNEPRAVEEYRPSADAYRPPVRSGLTDESKQAAAAALARFEGKKDVNISASLAAIRAQAKREIEAENASASSAGPSRNTDNEENNQLAASGVFFRCPLISNEILPQKEWEEKIRRFLEEQFQADPGLTAVLMVQSLNKNKEKVEACVETLIKYLKNILEHPSEEKYRRIKKTNKIYLEKIAPIEGASLVLEGAGFVTEGDCYVFPDTVSEDLIQHVEIIVDALKCAEPIPLELDRNLLVLIPSQAEKKCQLPRDFFKLTPEELKREQQARLETIEKSSMLLTKAMREKEAKRELRNYRFCIIRIRFRDGIMLQGTFGVYEPFTAVVDFLREVLVNPNDEFTLMTPLGEKLDLSCESPLIELNLIPTSVLIFNGMKENHLKPEVIVLGQDLQATQQTFSS